MTTSAELAHGILNALNQGPGARRTIAERAGVDLSDAQQAADLDKQIAAMRKAGYIYCTGQSYSITDKGRIAALPQVHICGIMTDKGPHLAIVTDPEQAAEIYRRMQVTRKSPVAFCMPIQIDQISNLPAEYQPGNPDPVPVTMLHTVRLKSVGPDKIQVIKTIRQICALGLKEAKDIVDGVTGYVITRDADDETAQRLIKAIAEAGGEASWRAEDDRPAE